MEKALVAFCTGVIGGALSLLYFLIPAAFLIIGLLAFGVLTWQIALAILFVPFFLGCLIGGVGGLLVNLDD